MKAYIITAQALMLVISSCSGLEQSEKQNMRKKNLVCETISRNHDEKKYEIATPSKEDSCRLDQ